MSIQKAFDILSETLGENFEYKGRMEEFEKLVISTLPIQKEFVVYLRSLYPNVKYVYFISEYDPVNRRNKLGDYRIVSENGNVLDTDDTLREKRFEVHSKIWNFLHDGLVEDLLVYDELQGEEFRFDLDTLECMNYEDYEEPAPILTAYETKLKEFSDYVLNEYPDAIFIDFYILIDKNDYSHFLGNFEVVGLDCYILDDMETLPNRVKTKIADYLNDRLVDDMTVHDVENGEKFRFELSTLQCYSIEDDEE